MRKCMWFYLLTKRLYKKLIFLVLFLLIPLLTFGYGEIAKQDGGILTVVLAAEDSDDPLAGQIMQLLMQDSKLLRFVVCATPEDAEERVRYGKADCAWIFESDLQNKVYAYIARPLASRAFVRVLERENSVTTRLAREKLTGTVFSCTAGDLYVAYVRENLPELASLTDAELLTYYNKIALDGKLFERAYAGSTQDTLLLSPVRGLLSVIVCLCGLAASLYYADDKARGTFAWLPQKKQFFAEFSTQAVAVANVAVVCLLSLVLLRQCGDFWRELSLLVLYTLCVCAFGMVLRRIFRNVRLLGMLLPLAAVILLAVCPVFLDLRQVQLLQLLLPPTYYIRGAYHRTYLLLTVPYSALCFGFCAIYDRVTKTL